MWYILLKMQVYDSLLERHVYFLFSEAFCGGNYGQLAGTVRQESSHSARQQQAATAHPGLIPRPPVAPSTLSHPGLIPRPPVAAPALAQRPAHHKQPQA